MRVGINGFGRIGRLVLRSMLERGRDLDIVAINGRGNPEMSAHLFQYDSTYGPYQGHVEARDDVINVDGRQITITAYDDPAEIPWGDLGVELVIESTGAFTSADKARAHLEAGAKRVLISAPGKGADATICVGVNEEDYDLETDYIISCASCTTNALAPMAKVVHNSFGIVRGMVTTIHSFTNDQNILDGTHRDPRRARAGGHNIVPTTTGATKALALVLPELKGRLGGIAYRVPTITVSVLDLVVQLERQASADEINAAFDTAANGDLSAVLGFTMLPLVSSDYRKESRSCVIDGLSTTVLDDSGLARIVGWYDNEWGYACRVVDLARYIGSCDAAGACPIQVPIIERENVSGISVERDGRERASVRV